jgi:hypothetical protein
MKLENLKQENFIEMCKLRLKHENKDFTEITIEDDTFRCYNGVSFIVKSEKFSDYRFSVSFDMFYPDEFMYLLGLCIRSNHDITNGIDFVKLAEDYLKSGDAFTVHALGIRDYAKWLNDNSDL